jgi:ABC-type uncharacterized transport system substrate-binding protein
MAYGIDVSDLGHHAADFVDQILKGAKPAEIPIFQPIKFELSVNLKTAKTLGIELPPLMLVLLELADAFLRLAARTQQDATPGDRARRHESDAV